MAGDKLLGAVAGGTDWGSITESLRQIWPIVCQAAHEHLAEFPTFAAHADRLRVYVRPDGGDLYCYVCSAPPRMHQSEVGTISVPHLETLYFHLLKQSEAEFERNHDELMRQVRSAIQAAFNPKLSPLPVYVVDYDDMETETPMGDVAT